MRRFEFIRTLNLAQMAAYFDRELGGSLPVDFQEWLSELIEEE